MPLGQALSKSLRTTVGVAWAIMSRPRTRTICLMWTLVLRNEIDEKEIVRKYREFVYETGAVNAGKGAKIDPKIVKQERKKKYELTRQDRFLYRSRYFTDAGIIGSKEFVKSMFDRFKHLLNCKPERKFTPVGGVEGVYSMKKLG